MDNVTLTLVRVTLDADDQRALKRMNDQMIAVRQFVAQVQQQGEQRLAQLQEMTRETWNAIGAKHNLDVENVSYELSKDGTELVPVSAKVNV